MIRGIQRRRSRNCEIIFLLFYRMILMLLEGVKSGVLELDQALSNKLFS